MIGLANEVAELCPTTLVMPHNYGLTDAHKNCLSAKVKLKTFELIDYKSIRKNAAMLFDLIRIVRHEKPDILHIQANGLRLFHWVAFFKPWRTKIVNTIHDPEKHSGDELSLAVDDSTVENMMRWFTRKYIVHGDNLIGMLARSYRVDKSKIVSIPHGHFEIYKRLQKENASEVHFTVLFFGRIWPYKGLDYFIQAANLAHRQTSEIRFCIAGTGEKIDKYMAMMENPSLFEVINKKVPVAEVGTLFQRASIVVLPYLDATQSGVIPIAYAYAKPAVATRVGALPNVVIDGQTGYLVDVRSAEQIAEKILFLWRNKAEKERLGEGAYQFAHDTLSWSRIASMTVSVYSGL